MKLSLPLLLRSGPLGLLVLGAVGPDTVSKHRRPSVSIGNVSVTEGSSGTQVATFTVDSHSRHRARHRASVRHPSVSLTSPAPGRSSVRVRLELHRDGAACGGGEAAASSPSIADRRRRRSPSPPTLTLRNDIDTVIDGGGLVTLDAGKRTRHFYFYNGNWMATPTTVTLQRLVLRNGKAPAGTYYPPNPTYPKCAYGYKEGSGGALFMRDGILHVIDCEFYDNEAALLGPDVGGGALYLLGVSGVVIVNSRFERNSAANGGAVGMLFANPQIYNSVFEDNTAVGVGMNYVEPECPLTFGHENQGGAGGLSGAVYFDGMDYASEPFTICGSVFRNNRCNELGGALFRTPNVETRTMVIDRSVFEANTAKAGSVSFIKQNNLTVRESLFTGNRDLRNVAGQPVSGWAGGLWVNEGTLNLVNSTFYDNSPGGVTLEGSGTVRNATFVDSPLELRALGATTPSSGTSPAGRRRELTTCSTRRREAARPTPSMRTPSSRAWQRTAVRPSTMMPASDSPALGQGNGCPATDQRGSGAQRERLRCREQWSGRRSHLGR